jgi:hypothetical protein
MEEYEVGMEVKNFLLGEVGERHCGSSVRRMWGVEQMEEGGSLWEKSEEAELDFSEETIHWMLEVRVLKRCYRSGSPGSDEQVVR